MDVVERLSDAIRTTQSGYPYYGVPQTMKAAKKEIERLRAEKELLAKMMIRQSLSTGHGDSLADLVAELEPQIERLLAELESTKQCAKVYLDTAGDTQQELDKCCDYDGLIDDLDAAIDAARKGEK